MQKIKALSSILLLGFYLLSAQQPEQEPQYGAYKKFNIACTTGFVMTSDFVGNTVNMQTIDGSFYLERSKAIGAKISYWKSRSFFGASKQIPCTVYLRGVKNLTSWPAVKVYGSVGGGAAWFIMDTYFSDANIFFPFYAAIFEPVTTIRGVGELEVGWEWVLGSNINFTNAIRWLFVPFQSDKGVGGLDIRFGLAFDF